jgi:hypothetical protein
MSNLIKLYFQGLFTSEINEPSIKVLHKVQTKVIEETNNELLAHFIDEEVKKIHIPTWRFTIEGFGRCLESTQLKKC